MSDVPAHYALIGHPVAHSLSPFIHNTAFKLLGLHADYSAISVHPHDLPELPSILEAKGIRGFNVTVPHKESILSLVRTMDETARTVGAVNTVHVVNGEWIGYNTDVKGFTDSLRQIEHREASCGAVVVGAGGSARAVVAALLREFPYEPITVINRTPDRARDLVERLHNSRLSAATWADVKFPVGLVVNCTTVGLYGEPMEIPVDVWGQHPVVVDLLYHRTTPLVTEARRRGCTVMDGLEMLMLQAAESLRIWTGLAMPVDRIRSTLRQKVIST